MKIVNNTHYYSIYNKVYNIVPDSDSWQFQTSKRLSYSQRLYWEYKFIKSVGGQAFFYTFTYNDASLPKFEFDKDVFDENLGSYVSKHFSFPCFNYSHIRLLTNGIISKVLRRQFGSQLRYFVACERGEGKGFRGKGQNPHYHVIFFISPLPDKVRKSTDVPYKRISPIQFCHLCKCVWQYNSSPNKYDHLVADYKSARFGHCQPGDDLGLITDFDALSYVSKYVCKDSLQVYDDFTVKEYFKEYFTKLGLTYHALYSFYQYLRLNGNISSRSDFMKYSFLDRYFGWRSLTGRRDLTWKRFVDLQYPIESQSFFCDFTQYFDELYLPFVVAQSYRDYFNIYGSKVRCSKSLGVYGLDFVKEASSNPHFVIYKSDEVISQPICLYYYRKIYMNVVHCPVTGNPLYVLNDKGLDLKCKSLPSYIDKLCNQVDSALNFLLSNSTDLSISSLLASRNLSIDALRCFVSSPNFADIIYRFSVYRSVYQYRFYSSFDSWQPSVSLFFTLDSFVSDYRHFLQSNFYTCDYSESRLISLIESHRLPSFVSFSCHPAFSSFIDCFNLIEAFFDVFREYMSEIKKKEFSDSTKLRQKLNAVKYSSVNI